MLKLPEFQALRDLSPDGRVLFTTRMVRLFAYGFLSVVLVLYLTQIGLNEQEVGVLLTLTLIGDAVISLWITGIADRIGRRQMLILGSGLMIFAGVIFALTGNIVLLTIAAIIGTISPSGNEVGPFLSIEQAILPQTISDKQRTQIFAWYGLVGSFSTATGALFGGGLSGLLQNIGVSTLYSSLKLIPGLNELLKLPRPAVSPLDSYRVVIIGYALLGLVLGIIFTRLSPQIEVTLQAAASVNKNRFGLHRSRNIVVRLAMLFMVDAFAGGLVVPSFVAYWFNKRWGVDPAGLGAIFFGANFLAGLSALAAARVAARIGLLNTMIWTHVPSNILLILVPIMPNLTLAILFLLARFSISQMDVPTRQSYTMAVVDPDERSAAAGVTNIARTLATAISPTVTGALFTGGFFSVPFFLAGGLKLVYDFTLARSFSSVKPPEEQTQK